MRVVVLTGAGISAESGLATFRGAGGLWEGHAVEDVATPEAFARDPALVHRFYDMRRPRAKSAQPNAVHRALARLREVHDLTLVTQNVDDLHDRGGANDVIHMHGRLDGALCAGCGHRWPAPESLAGLLCPARGAKEARPDIVWFGEMPYEMDRILAALEACDVFAAIGTSGQVYPAAGFGRIAAQAGAHTVELNLDRSAISRDFHEHRIGPATETVPAWVEELSARA
ncbi:NAD-dependent protein deacylase [Paracoccus sp. S-4012]|uniref:NAD-dependent deacylase n=1 Tax=Paracoccus sp. S-4012 TaxID=2665648 RepID=UPI0012AF2B9A|nr:NAD-dependent deacylase [Paracoccus sp. S-4012]MRX50519.1 NAD-dependent protein deacylase [Paracoccus sp. S-4012]